MFGFLLGNKYLAIAKWIAIAGCVWYIFHTWDKAQGYDAMKADRDKVVTDHNAYIATRAAQDSITAKVSTDYENAVTDLTNQLNNSRNSVPVIRVCHKPLQASASNSSAASGPNATSKDGPSGSNEEVVTTISTDEPIKIAGEAQKCGEQLNHLEDWIRKQSTIIK